MRICTSTLDKEMIPINKRCFLTLFAVLPLLLFGTTVATGTAAPTAADAAALIAAAAQPDAPPASSAEDRPLKPVQVFDVEAGKVVYTLPNDPEYQEMAKRWLQSVKGLSPKVSPDDRCGFVYRVPLGEPFTVNIDQSPIVVQDVFLFYCKHTAPVLLVFDPNNKPFLLTFEADLGPFLRKIAAPSPG